MKTILKIFSITCATALGILVICSFFYYLVPIDFPGTVGEWITALSTLAGGSLTLGGVWWTINDNKKQKEKELFFQYRPIIISENLISVIENDLSQLIIENKGYSELLDISITCDKEWVYFKLNIGPEGRNIILPGSKHGFQWSCSFEKIKQCSEISFTIKGRTYLNAKIETKFTFKVTNLSKTQVNLVLITTNCTDSLTSDKKIKEKGIPLKVWYSLNEKITID